MLVNKTNIFYSKYPGGGIYCNIDVEMSIVLVN